MRVGPIFKEIFDCIEKQVMDNKVPLTKYEKNLVAVAIVYSHAYYCKAQTMEDAPRLHQFSKEVLQWGEKEFLDFHKLFKTVRKWDEA